MLMLPNDVVSCVLLHVDSLGDVRALFRVNRHLASFAASQRLSLMWCEKQLGRKVAFRHALTVGDYVFVREMIPRMTSDERFGFLRSVLEQGIAELVAPLLDPARNINAVSSLTRTRLLHYPATGEAASVLLAVPGIDVNATDFMNFTPLHYAAMSGYDGVVAALLAAPGIDVNKKGPSRLSVLHIAAVNGRTGIIDMLREAPGILVNAQDASFETALYRVSSRDAARALLAFPGVKVNVAARDGITPLHAAVKAGHWEVVQELIAAGADVNAADVNGMTPLHIAVQDGQHESVATLLAAPGVNVNAQSNNGDTPLHTAVKFNRSDLGFTLLCAQSTDVTIRDNAGFTALQYGV